jgi:hypothetical protein
MDHPFVAPLLPALLHALLHAPLPRRGEPSLRILAG